VLNDEYENYERDNKIHEPCLSESLGRAGFSKKIRELLANV
jgi:hypothetical protein